MPRKIRQLKRDLWRAGAYLAMEKGDHEKWKHDLMPELLVELAGKDGDDAKPYQEKHVLALLQRIQHAKKEQQKP